ncbi:hypothetical protein [Rummeliibacillus suwonensis]|uniref:hypothetical protein n=1 Tax=Rummeliibacillus suwonensis TaxID=1306154 RepID=UPI001AAEBF1E|nr:hypothetical protein [Rummeliibacillus suwonensis]MBO2536292.1 hypothetical protein [Rummeliibacillus suwonensis]
METVLELHLVNYLNKDKEIVANILVTTGLKVIDSIPLGTFVLRGDMMNEFKEFKTSFDKLYSDVFIELLHKKLGDTNGQQAG